MLTLSAAAQSLYDQLTADMETAGAGMDANKADFNAHRNFQAAYCDARDARTQLCWAADPEGMAQQEDDYANACAAEAHL